MKARAVAAAWLAGFLCAAIGLACSQGDRKRPGTPPHNVLLVTCGGLRKDHLSSYMYARPTSAWPATEEERRQGRALSLDDLAEQGVVFADASSGAIRSFPAAVQLLTGTRGAVPDDTRKDVALELEATTIAERFKDAGFKTAAFVAGPWMREARGLDQGFGTWFWRNADMAVLDQARQWIVDAEPDAKQSWFVWVHLAGGDPPHDPRGLPNLPGEVPGVLDFGRLYADANYKGAADGSPAYLEKLKKGELVADEKDRARLIDLYDGEVARLAASVRNLALSLRNLDEQGRRWNDTLFVFAGLHGVELGDSDPRAWGSDSLSASVVGAPLILRHPLSLTGSRVMAEPVGLEDVAPTLAEWFGLAPLPRRERSIAGRSLLPLVDTYVQREFEHRPAFAELTGPNASRALRTREWTIVERADHGEVQTALYDRIADPAERNDLSATESERCAQMRAALEQASFEAARTP